MISLMASRDIDRKIVMSDSIQIKKLKRIMYQSLRWRLQLPNYVPHYPIPSDDKLGEFSRGVKCAYRDLLEEIEKIERSENQRRFWRKKKGDFFPMFGNEEDEEEDFVEEMRKWT